VGITELSDSSVHSENQVCHLDVGSKFPDAETGIKGSTVRRLKFSVNWVKNGVSQFCFYPEFFCKKKAFILVWEEQKEKVNG